MSYFLGGAILTALIVTGLIYFAGDTWLEINNPSIINQSAPQFDIETIQKTTEETQLIDMAVKKLRAKEYTGSQIEIEQTLEPGSNFSRYIASYQSEGNKIYGLLTVPNTEKPGKGFPIIAFLHGYIPPDQYKTTERYVEYQAGLARNGFITYKIDLRGHGESEGQAVSAHFSEAYVVDTLNAVNSLKQYPDANPEKIGIWGHSNGGQIGLRSMVVFDEVNAGVFWAGVVGSFEGMLEIYNADIPFLNLEKRGTPTLVQEHGLPSENPEFWLTIDPYNYLSDINGAIQMHHGTADDSVPIELSRQLKNALEAENKPVELYEYPGGDHNLSSPHFTPAIQRSIDFFKLHLSE